MLFASANDSALAVLIDTGLSRFSKFSECTDGAISLAGYQA